jgi:hypothetical protein
MVDVISPTEKPRNLDGVVSILASLSRLDYFGPYIDVWYAYTEITPAVQGRFDSIKTFAQTRIDNTGLRGVYTEIFSGRPQEMLQLLTSPYPSQIDLHYGVTTWSDSGSFNDTCRIALIGQMCYFISLDREANEYYISKEPGIMEVYSPSFGILPRFPLKDGVPAYCHDHVPYMDTCSKRFKEINQIVEKTGLPKKIKKESTLSEILKQNPLT